MAGRLTATFVQQGQQGAAIPQESFKYTSYTGGPQPLFPLASDTVYGNADGTDPRTTTFTSSFQSGTDLLQGRTTTLPTIGTGQNGPGGSAGDAGTDVFDVYGNLAWHKDGDGFITYDQHDPATGGLVKHIDDVNTADTGDFANLPSGWTTPTGGGLELITSYQVDAQGRTTLMTDPNGNQTYFVYHDGHAAGSGGFVNEVRVYPGWHQIGTSGTYTTTGPVQVTREYRPAPGAASGQQTVYDETLSFTAPVESTTTPSGTETIDQTVIQSLSRQQTNNAGQMIESDAYSSLSGLTYSASLALLANATLATNTQSGNVSVTIYAYDGRGRLDRVVDPNGTIYHTIYDGLGRVVSRYVGTNDTPASGYWSPTNNTAPANMVDVEDDTYDNGAVGDSNLTAQVLHTSNASAGDHATIYLYDWRDRLIALKQGALLNSNGTPNPTGETDSAHRLITFNNLDNLGEAIGTYTYAADGVSLTDFATWTSSTDAADLRAYTSQSFDDQGRVYQSLQYSVDPTSGAIGSDLAANTFYDHRGNVIETSNPGGLVYKHAFDGAGRDVKDSTTDGGVLNGAAPDWSHAGSTTSDVVIEQTITSYDMDGNAIETQFRQRFDNDPTTATGDLAGPAGGNLASRDYYTASYFDAANRLTDQVNVGTNGGTTWTRPASVPTASNTVLVTHTDYDPASRVLDTVDPRGIKAGTFYDMLGRSTETIAAWDGTQNPTPGNSANQITTYTYDGNGDVLIMTAKQPSGGTTPDQQTGYLYGVGATIGTDLFSNDLVSTIEYPDKSTGAPATSANERQGFGYDWQVEKTSMVDQLATTHNYNYDVLARLTADKIIQLGVGVDSTVQRLGYSFDSAGRPYQQTSYSDAAGTTVVNQLTDTYNGYGQLISELQDHGGGTTGTVQYGYSQPAGANYSRLTSMTYPNGRLLDYAYGVQEPFSSIIASGTTATVVYSGPNQFAVGDTIQVSGAAATQLDGTFTITGINTSNGRLTYTLPQSYTGSDSSPDITALDLTAGGGSGALNNAISRVAGVQDHAGSSPGNLQLDTYLGLNTIVQRDDANLLRLAYINQPADSHALNDGGDRYSGLDRFGRVDDQFWLTVGQPALPIDRLQYGYDADSNVLYRNNLANSAFSELYHANGSSNGYDNLNRLTNFQRGTLNSTHDSITGTPSATNNWNLDALGNWTGTQNGSQTRTFNAQNQIVSISGLTTPTYDNNGNMTRDQAGNTYTFDAWNRIGEVNGTYAYHYDATGRRIYEGTSGHDLYYNTGGNVLEERSGSTITSQTVWGLGYQNALVLRDDNSTSGNLGASGSGLGRRIYVLQDANWNVTAALTGNRSVVQRYVYDPYGSQTVLNSSWNAATDVAGLLYGFQGGRRDPVSGKVHFGYRDLNTGTGAWMQQDPLGTPLTMQDDSAVALALFSVSDRFGSSTATDDVLGQYSDGTNLYQFTRSNPIAWVDPTGLKTIVDGPFPTYDGDRHAVYRYHYYNGTTYLGFKDYPRVDPNKGDPTGHPFDKDIDCVCHADARYAGTSNQVAIDNAATTRNGLLVTAGAATAAGVGQVLGAIRGPNPSSGPQITIDTTHASPHYVGTGISQAAVEAAIEADVRAANLASCPVGRLPFRQITVGGTVIEYRPYMLPNGTINVGTHYPVGP